MKTMKFVAFYQYCMHRTLNIINNENICLTFLPPAYGSLCEGPKCIKLDGRSTGHRATWNRGQKAFWHTCCLKNSLILPLYFIQMSRASSLDSTIFLRNTHEKMVKLFITVVIRLFPNTFSRNKLEQSSSRYLL